MDIHSVDRIVPELQTIEVGDEVRAPEGRPDGLVRGAGPHLVLRPGRAAGWTTIRTWERPSTSAGPSCSQVIRPEDPLLVRERYGLLRPRAVRHCRTPRGRQCLRGYQQLRGIRDRAARTAATPTSSQRRAGLLSLVRGELPHNALRTEQYQAANRLLMPWRPRFRGIGRSRPLRSAGLGEPAYGDSTPSRRIVSPSSIGSTSASPSSNAPALSAAVMAGCSTDSWPR